MVALLETRDGGGGVFLGGMMDHRLWCVVAPLMTIVGMQVDDEASNHTSNTRMDSGDNKGQNYGKEVTCGGVFVKMWCDVSILSLKKELWTGGEIAKMS